MRSKTIFLTRFQNICVYFSINLIYPWNWIHMTRQFLKSSVLREVINYQNVIYRVLINDCLFLVAYFKGLVSLLSLLIGGKIILFIGHLMKDIWFIYFPPLSTRKSKKKHWKNKKNAILSMVLAIIFYHMMLQWTYFARNQILNYLWSL